MKRILAVAVLALLAGCSTGPAPDPGPTRSGPSAERTSSDEIDEAEPTDGPTVVADAAPVRVGVLVGARLSDVRRGLAPLGLRVAVRARAACGPGVVVSQRPAPGTEVPPGATVRLVVSRAPATATCALPRAATAARRLEAWASGDEPVPGLADRVRLLVANRPVRTLSAARAADPAAWTLDVAYAERTDVRILDLLSSAAMADRDVPPWFCPVKGEALPDDLVRRLPFSWSLVTRHPRACMDEAAVQVWTDRAGRITDVNVLMGSP